MVLKKINRLGGRKEFEEVKAKGRVSQYGSFGVVKAREDDEEKKFGVVVSKRISKKAVERNKIRRVIMEAVRKRLGEIRGGSRWIFLVKRNILGKRTEEIERETGEVISKQ